MQMRWSISLLLFVIMLFVPAGCGGAPELPMEEEMGQEEIPNDDLEVPPP